MRRYLTHSGTFHCDDVVAYVAFRLSHSLGLSGGDHRLIRTRDPDLIESADVVWDVGGVHDPSAGRFDHHQRGAPVRSDTGVPLSAAGLVWRVHGPATVQAVLGSISSEAARSIATIVDDEIIRRIDAIDNGVDHPGDTIGLSSLVEDFNPSWDGDAQEADDAFLAAAALAEIVLRNRIEKARGRLLANSVVAEACLQAADPRVIELPSKMPWQNAVFTLRSPAFYAVYPVPDGNYVVDTMPIEPRSHEQRLPLPEAWAGLRGAELCQASGVKDAVFVHARRFLGVAKTRQGAIDLAFGSIRLAV